MITYHIQLSIVISLVYMRLSNKYFPRILYFPEVIKPTTLWILHMTTFVFLFLILIILFTSFLYPMSLKIICTFSFVSKSLWITYFSSNTDFLPSYEKWNIRKRYEVLSQNQGRKKWFRSHSTLATIVEMSSLRCNISITMDHHSYSLPSGSCKHPRLKDVLSLQKTEMNLPMAKSLLEIPNGVKLKGMSKVKSDNHQLN